MTLYWSHMNDMHHDILENLLTPKLIVQLHDKLVNQGEVIEGFNKFKPVPRIEPGNNKMPAMFTFQFRELMNLAKDKMPFEDIVLRYFNKEIFSKLDDLYTPIILRGVQQFLQNYTTTNATPTKNPMNAEVPWSTRGKMAFGNFNNGHCPKCRDTCFHEPNDPHCFIRADHMSNADYVFIYDNLTHLNAYDATLIGHEGECWGTSPIMPKDTSTNRSLNLLNVSERKATARYPTGTVNGIPVLMKKGCEPKPLASNYFTHIRRMLDKMRRNIRQPILIEYFPSFESTDPEDFHNMALGWLAEYQKLKEKYNYFFITLMPYPKYLNAVNIGMFLEDQARTKQMNCIFAAYATKLGLCVLPTEGLLYSLPLDETHTKWFWCPDRCEPLRNNTGTGTRELYRRAGVLVDVAVKNYKVFKSLNDKATRKVARYRGIDPDTLDKDGNSSDAEIETDYSDSEDAATTSNPVANANPGYEFGCFTYSK